MCGIAFTPFSRDVEAGYDPAINFTDGSVALYADAVQAGADGLGAPPPAPPTATSDSLPAIAQPTRTIFAIAPGRCCRTAGARRARRRWIAASAYVLFGSSARRSARRSTTIFDPALPAWLAAYLNREMPAILADYRRAPRPVAGRRSRP